MKAYTNTTT